MRAGGSIGVLVLLAALSIAAATPMDGRPLRIDSVVADGAPTPRLPARSAVDWCGLGQQTALDRKPDSDLSSPQQVHVTYAVPADSPNQFATRASQIATDAAAIDAWWRREDATRTLRYDLFAFPGCGSKFGGLDLGFVRLPRAGSLYLGETGADALLTDLSDLDALSSQKHLVYYDGPAPFESKVCGTAFVPRSATTQGGFAGIAFVWLQSLCGGDVGAGNLNAAVAVHEVIHALGALQSNSPNECAPPNDGHVCDSVFDILYPEASSQTTLSSQRLDAEHDDYYGHSLNTFDVQDSAWLSHLPQQRLSLTIRRTGSARGSVEMTSPSAFACAQSCAILLDLGIATRLVAKPAAGARFVGWQGACSGRSACTTTLTAARAVTAVFGPSAFLLTVGIGGRGKVSSSPAGLACPTRCTARFRADAKVRLRASASPGFVFAGWKGTCRGKGACVVTVDRNRSVLATFARR